LFHRWNSAAAAIAPGDVVLFPSYLMHAVPPNPGERRITLSGQGEYNSLGELIDGSSDTGYRISASYVDQFADDTIGFAIGAARMASPFQEQQEKAWWWGNPDAWGAPQVGKPPGAETSARLTALPAPSEASPVQESAALRTQPAPVPVPFQNSVRKPTGKSSISEP